MIKNGTMIQRETIRAIFENALKSPNSVRRPKRMVVTTLIRNMIAKIFAILSVFSAFFLSFLFLFNLSFFLLSSCDRYGRRYFILSQ